MKLANKLKTGILATALTGLIGCAEFEEIEKVYTNPDDSTRTKQIQGPTWTHRPLEVYDETRIIRSGYYWGGVFSIYEDGVQWVSNKRKYWSSIDKGNYWFSIPYENIQHTQVLKKGGLFKINSLIIHLPSREWKSIYFANDNVEEIKQKVDEMWKNYLSNKAN